MSGDPAGVALKARAERAAAAIIAAHDLGNLGISYDLLVTIIAVGWLEGWQDGGDEAKAILADALAKYARAGIHAVL